VLGYVIWLVAERHPLLFISVPGFILVLLGLFYGIITLDSANPLSEGELPLGGFASLIGGVKKSTKRS